MVFLLLLSLIIGITPISAEDEFDYCLPSNISCWPSQAEWNELRSKIKGGKLHDISDDSEYDKVCNASTAFTDPMSAHTLEDRGEGRCMQYHDCAKEKCDDGANWNIPEYSVEASEESDIVEAIKFANRHNIQVVVKTTGHNFAGASMGDGTLLIWMRHFKKYGDVKTSYEKCSKTYDAVLKVGGGQVWGETYRAAGSADYHVVGGDCITVSSAGGWLMGGGLSASARLYGLGIDQIVEFEVITADGLKVTASECENDDLFWALRGGGGGSFGVTTSVHYKLHATKPFCRIKFEPKNKSKWIDVLVDSAPTFDVKWGGNWAVSFGDFYYQGTAQEMKKDEFYKKITLLDKEMVKFNCAKSYFAAKGGPDNLQTYVSGWDTYHVASRLVPMEFVKNSPDKLKDILKWIIQNDIPSNAHSYILGGKMMDVATNATAVHPAMRRSVFQINTFDERAIQRLRDEIPDSGAGFNHAAKNEPDWENQFWGTNRPRLERLKKKWDPENRFNCWHCVGYLSTTFDEGEQNIWR